jgi:3-deoxy-D-arabino-heptulosonate 7-phosphate (DAHP) synthase class II
MAITLIGRRRRLRTLPTVRQLTPSRDWLSTRQAAIRLGISESTLRRRTLKPAWREGVHYRWIGRRSRQTMEVNVTQAIKLMNAIGWG